MFRTTAALGLLAASFGASDIANAQYYPPYYRAPAPYYGGPPAEWDIDDLPVGSVPGDVDTPRGPAAAPRANAAPDPYYRPPARYGAAPSYPESRVERDPYGLPPPGVQQPYPQPPAQAYPAPPAQPYPQPQPYPPAQAYPQPPAQAYPQPPAQAYPQPPAQAYPQPPAQAAVPVQPDPGYGVPAMRPPGAIGGEQMASLPPDIRPESGERKAQDPRFRRQVVPFNTREPAGTIIVDTPNTYLYLVLGNGQAMRYGIGVGREGFTWSGTQRISRMAEWPDWHPPAEMIERQPYLPRFMAGGPGNPLGARALYLGNTIYRIHGTNQPSTIGTFVSSGCIRLVNEDVEDLYGRVQVGTRVVVLPKSDTTAAAPPPYHQR
jgi:lipoprotein-anchoring transpeptidase ErfK/SrfK